MRVGRERKSPADVNVDVIHSDMSLKARQEAVTRFRTGDTWVLIATDLLGRGLDFLGLNTVLNYDFPQVGLMHVHHRRVASTMCIVWDERDARDAKEPLSRCLRRKTSRCFAPSPTS